MSPIRGLTDRGLSFPQIGTIRKGSPKQKRTNADGSEYEIQGKDLNYFRVEFDESEVKASTLFKTLYGETPNTLKVTFPFNEVDRVWSAYLEAYTSNRLVARSDGELILRWREGKEIYVKNGLATADRVVKIWKRTEGKHTDPLEVPMKADQPVPYIENMVFHRTEKTLTEAKPVGRLRVTLYELNRLGYLLLATTSQNDIIAIGGPDSGELGSIKVFCDSLGLPFAGVPLILRRKPQMVAYTDEKGKQSRTKRWLVHIEPDPEFAEMAFAKSRRLAMPDMPMLQTGFHPEELKGVNEPEDIEDDIPAGEPEDFEEGKEVKDEEPKVELPVTPATDAPKYRYNNDKIIAAVKKITSFSTEEAARTMHEAWKRQKIETELTVKDAEKFARSLVPA